MSVINVLPPHVADMIAAGEVVERPGSVVKELMENALDAGAKNIVAEISRGGADRIRVTDDGCGMAPDDAGTCFLRHATSKLSDERGLEAIATMGFRGEALAAIAAVSRVTLDTRRPADDAGTHVEVAGGELLDMCPTGCPPGTTFVVSDLFYNTPARLKFMKSDRAEGSHCVSLALRVALGRPDVSVRCVKDGREEFFTPGDGRPASAVYALLGRDAARSMLPMEGQSDGVTVRGFVSSPAAGRGSRSMQYFFVNGRWIRSQTMQAAVEQAYKNTLLTGRYPACVIYVDISPGAVDVNVHPTKSEVKFSQEKRVFDAVYYGTLSALQAESFVAADEKPPADPPAAPAADPAAEPPAPPWDRFADRPAPRDITGWEYHGNTNPAADSSPRPAPAEAALPYAAAAPVRPAVHSAPVTYVGSPADKGGPGPDAEEPGPSLFDTGAVKKSPPVRVVGEVMKTYIIAETGDTMLMIDKHAAHERMNFDRLKAQSGPAMSQSLLVPAPWRADGETLDVLSGSRPLLEELGFAFDVMADDNVLIRGVPADLDPAQAVPALEEICRKLRRGGGDLSRDEILQTISCKAAIKAGWDTDPLELQILAEKVAAGEIRYCPHGRPVAVALTRKELDKQFKRIV